MARKDECTNCPKSKKGYGDEIRCTYLGRNPMFDDTPCSFYNSLRHKTEEGEGNQQANNNSGLENNTHTKEDNRPNKESSQNSDNMHDNTARIICPECGKEISSVAKTCPNCGFPMDEKKDIETGRTSSSREQHDEKMKQKKCPDCGAALASDAKVCPQCGCQLYKQNDAPKFSSKSLIQGEKIFCSAKWHWINYATFILLGLIGLICFIYPLAKQEYLYYLDLENLVLYGFILFLILLFFSIYGIISINYNEFVVTNRRIIIKSGIIRRASYELRLEKLESIQVYQGILGRILGYGTILVHGVGASRQSVMRIDSPLEFRQHIFTELSKQNNQNEE